MESDFLTKASLVIDNVIKIAKYFLISQGLRNNESRICWGGITILCYAIIVIRYRIYSSFKE